MRDEHMMLLGEIKGKVDLIISNQETQGDKINSIDSRLRRAEKKAAIDGAVTGSLASIGVTLVVEGIKKHLWA